MFLLVARLLLAFLFVFAGVQKLLNFDATSGLINTTIENAQVPFYADASKEVDELQMDFGDTLPFLQPKAEPETLPEAMETAEAMVMELTGERDYFSLSDLLTSLAIFIELIGGIFIILGFGTRFFAVVIFLFLIPVNVLFHGFWMAGMQEEMMAFIKNLAIMGGLLALAVAGPGGLSLSGGDRKSMEDDF